ncbi:Ldh family oxidoreductase [Pandoraea sp. PE-S2T-3]|uniref:Ldh family oxidoreductase n=1 Tax=Pandoraea sp. PE-S2T-3 TaxID=1986993 RepID=UPI000B403C64|nr:Ldh family oxidoreductase [Pandoraea sp. PE-S2T-3]
MTANLLSCQEATEVSVQALTRHGVSQENARIQTEQWVEAELRGRASHGLLRLPRIVERLRKGLAHPLSHGVHQWRGSSLLDVDGERGLGPVVAFAALEKISARAKETGLAAAMVRNSNHLGMLALYAERIAAQGQVLIALSTSEALVHPWGGKHAMLGTNPVAIGVPALPHPFVFDMATSAVSMGQIHDYANQNRPLKPGWALDAEGNPTTDAHAAKAGAIAPFGDAKGYALGIAFEVLVSSLTAAALGTDVRGTLDAEHVCNKGDVFIVLESAPGGMAGQISAYLDAVRACEPADPDRPVVVPGDRAQTQRERSLRDGFALAPDVWARIRELAGISSDSVQDQK